MFRIPNLGVKGRLKKDIIPEGKKLLRGISGSGIRPFGFFMEGVMLERHKRCKKFDSCKV